MRIKKCNALMRPAIAAGVALALLCGIMPVLEAADSKADAKPAKKAKLTGSELYQIHCSRCHTERYPTEFNSREWQTIMMHMRVRANLPAVQAKEILNYLKEESK